MKAGKYNISDLFVNRHLEQIIIPEIQRDYVWSKDQIEGLLDSLLFDFYQYKNATDPIPDLPDQALAKEFTDFYNRRKYASSIGFIYAYNDETFPGKYFLIDGQQRLTTIYLILLFIASKDDDCQKIFSRKYLIEDKPKLDYRVRESAHEFLTKFVKLILSCNGEAKDQNWYYKAYDQDITIQNVIANLKIISQHLTDHLSNVKPFFNYLENLLQCWYFDTNISEQGEELYIYMNARGEQIKDNENIKAALLSNLTETEEKNKYGLLWENWQDFFWVNKGSNINADKGFNEFLCCIAGLQNYLKGKKVFYKPTEFKDGTGIKTKDILATISINHLKKYAEVLIFLNNQQQEFSNQYSYSAWVKSAMDEIWFILNKETTNWFADYTDDNRSTERNRMVYLWSVLHYLNSVDMLEQNIPDIYRVLRMYYLRYKNFNRSVTSIKSTIEFMSSLQGVFDSVYGSHPDDLLTVTLPDDAEEMIRTEEEILKAKYFRGIKDETILKESEALIWKIEDHPYNLDGRDVGATNISHLIDLSTNPDKGALSLVFNKFYEVFPIGQAPYHTVKNILLYYGVYWYRDTPYYYRNFDFSYWKAIIRDRVVEKNETRKTFSEFFAEFCQFRGSLQDLLNKKRNQAPRNQIASTLSEKLIWYNERLGDDMWREGEYIAISNGTPCGFNDWKNRDKYFDDEFIIYNTKGNLKGGNPQALFELITTNNESYN